MRRLAGGRRGKEKGRRGGIRGGGGVGEEEEEVGVLLGPSERSQKSSWLTCIPTLRTLRPIVGEGCFTQCIPV